MMADPTYLVSGVIRTSGRVATALMHYAKEVKDAPKQVCLIELEARKIKLVLETLEATLDQMQDPVAKEQLMESLRQCQSTLCELEQLVAPEEEIFESESVVARPRTPTDAYRTRNKIAALITAQVSTGYHNGRRSESTYKSRMSTSRRFIYPLIEQAKVKDLLDRLRAHNATLTLSLDVTNTINLNSIGNTIKDIEANLNDNEKRRVLTWLKPPRLDMREFHREQHDKQEDETCEWMTKGDRWKQWLKGGGTDPDGYQRFAWIFGIPGAGKTVLASFLIDEIAKYCRATGYSYYYCFHERDQEETIPLLRWIIGDLSRQAGRFIPKILEELHATEAFTIQGLESCLLALCEWFKEKGQRVYLVIDAVDESKRPRKRLLDLLIRIGTDSSFDNVSLLMTSRDEIDIREAMDDLRRPDLSRPLFADAKLLEPFTSITMSNKEVTLAIRKYVNKQFARSSKFRMWDKKFREKVAADLARNARGMFRWVACQIDILERLYLDPGRVEEALHDMPEDLFGVYAKILEQIPPEQRAFAKTALTLICSNTSNIKSADVLVAASLHNVQHGEIHQYGVQPLKEILGCLIKMSDMKKRPERIFAREDEDGLILQKVSVAHYTVREFLFAHSKKEGEPRPAKSFALSNPEIRTLEMQVVFNGLQRWGMNRPLGHRFPTRYEEHCLEMSEAALRKDRQGILIRNESVWKSVIPCLSPGGRHLRDLTNQKIRRRFPKWSRLLAFEELTLEPNPGGRAPTPLQQETGILASSVLLEWPEFARKFLQDPGFKTLAPKKQQAVWTDRFTIDSAIDDIIPKALNKRTPMTLIRLCVVMKHVELLELFLDAGATLANEPNIIHRALCDPYGRGDEDGALTGQLLKVLLEAGADPEPPGYKYTPLQFAVSQLEEGWVQSLLLDGRDANSVGDRTGRHPCIGGEVKAWHSQPPLEICETINPSWQGQEEEKDKARKQVREILVQYGAKQRPQQESTEQRSTGESRMVINLDT